MSYPESVSVATVIVGDASDFHGDDLDVQVFVTPILGGEATHLVHEASGAILAPLENKFTSSYAGATISFDLPHVDQSGFRDESGAAATGWSYRALVQVFKSGSKRVEYEKTFQVVTGQTIVDLDLIAGGPTIEPMTSIVPAVTSVNGKTGPVVMTGEAATDAALAVIQSVAAEREVRLSELRRYRGRVSVRKRAAVALVMDHGLNKFDASVRPLLESRGLPVTLALNSNWQDPADSRYSTNDLVTPAMVAGWVDAGWLEPANHGRTHQGYSTDEAMTTEIVTGREELESMLGHRVDSWVQPSMTTGDGFNSGGDQSEYWSTHTGRTILRSHAVVSGVAPGGSLYPLDGEPVVGMKGGWIDTSTTGVESAIESAISSGTGYVVRFHPQYLDASGYLTSADLTAFLDKLVAWRDEGDLDVLQFRDLAIADAAVPAEYDSGWRIMPAFTGNRADPARPGEWRLRRRGDRVTAQLVAVGIAGDGMGFLGANALPAGFTMAPNVARVFEGASQHSSGVVSTVGWSHKIMVSDNDVTWRGVYNLDGARVATTPTNYASLVHAELEWTTNDGIPTTLPGTAG